MNREEKQKAIDALREKFSRSKGVVLAEYKGMTVAEVSDLRNKFRVAGIDYKVVKNTLARIASEGTPVEGAKAAFKGPLGIAIGYDDPVLVVREALDFAKKNDKFKVQCGVVDGTFVDGKGIKVIAGLPSRPVLLGILAGTMQAPASQMARLLAATVVRMGYALTALKDKKEAAGAA